MTYAVGILPQKLARVAELQDRGARLTVVTDSLEWAEVLTAEAGRLRDEGAAPIPILIEVDCASGRAGLPPEAPELVELGRRLEASPGFALQGILTHAGHSYDCRSVEAVAEVAEVERAAAVTAAEALRAAGLSAPVVSVGSTPTALHARHLEGVTEMRPGVYMLGDLTQVALGSCRAEEIAAAVLTRVIGHNRQAGHLLIDAGGLALSKDLGADSLLPDVGYGRICDRDFKRLDRRSLCRFCASGARPGEGAGRCATRLRPLSPGPGTAGPAQPHLHDRAAYGLSCDGRVDGSAQMIIRRVHELDETAAAGPGSWSTSTMATAASA